jgi:hypothetical protein
VEEGDVHGKEETLSGAVAEYRASPVFNSWMTKHRGINHFLRGVCI